MIGLDEKTMIEKFAAEIGKAEKNAERIEKYFMKVQTLFKLFKKLGWKPTLTFFETRHPYRVEIKLSTTLGKERMNQEEFFSLGFSSCSYSKRENIELVCYVEW